MTTEHKAGKWLYTTEGVNSMGLIEPDGTVILHLQTLANSAAARDMEANVRRIVACVNACDGLSTEDIEEGDTTTSVRLMHQIRELRIQRDGLLAALQSIVRITDGSQPIDHPGALMVANHAIAKIGGAA